MKKTKKLSHNSSENQDTNNEIYELFRAGRKVDVVFYANPMSSPDVKSAMIYNCDHDSKTIIISQTNPATYPSIRFDKLGITTLLVKKSKQKVRFGVNCRISKFVKDYSLNEKTRVNAIEIKYFGTMETYNIRETYRFEPPIEYEVTGQIAHKKDVYFSVEDFRIHNISIGGAGIVVKKRINTIRSPLLGMSVNEKLKTEFNLINFHSMMYENTIFIVADVVWIDPSYSDKFGYIGIRFVEPDHNEIDELHRFIHNGQLIHIRMAQGYDRKLPIMQGFEEKLGYKDQLVITALKKAVSDSENPMIKKIIGNALRKLGVNPIIAKAGNISVLRQQRRG